MSLTFLANLYGVINGSLLDYQTKISFSDEVNGDFTVTIREMVPAAGMIFDPSRAADNDEIVSVAAFFGCRSSGQRHDPIFQFTGHVTAVGSPDGESLEYTVTRDHDGKQPTWNRKREHVPRMPRRAEPPALEPVVAITRPGVDAYDERPPSGGWGGKVASALADLNRPIARKS